MKSVRAGLTAAAACVALAACHIPGFGGGSGKTPSGQVVATVGQREVTVRELRAETGDASFPDATARKAGEQQALRNILGRVILADAARAQGLDKTPDFALLKQRAIDEVLARMLQQKIIKDVPPPSSEDVQSFMAGHPDIFLERKVFTVDQIRMPRPSDPAVLKDLQPLTTLEQVEDKLKADKVPYQRQTGALDAVGMDPEMLKKIMDLPKDDIFVVPNGAGLSVNQIKGAKVVPFSGDEATGYAQKLVMRIRTQDAVKRAFGQIMGQARPNVKISKEYAPPPAKAPAAGASPAPSASPAQ